MLMAADLPVPEHVFVHGFLLGADGRKMSKSLGNVLDPFEVHRRVRHRRAALLPDARRRLRRRRRGRDGRGRGSRYESELANEYGNLASRTLAMIRRYRDGVVPAGRPPTRRSRRSSTGLPSEVAALLDRAEATQALELIWQRVRRLQPLRRGARAVAAGQGSRRAPASSTGRSPRWPRACASSACCCTRTCRRAPSSCSTRSARRRSTTPAPRSPRGSGAHVDALEPLFPKRDGDRQPHPPATAASRPTPSSSRAADAGRGDADRHRRHRRRHLPRGARRRRGLPAGLRGDRPPPERGHRLRRRRPRRARGAGRPPALRGDRRDRPRLLPRLRARATTSSAPSRPRSSSRATTGKPLVIHTRAADDDTLAMLEPSAPPGSR